MRQTPFATAALLALVVALSGCWPEEDGDYFEIEGGGFIVNYRLSETFYGFVARPRRDLPAGGVLEARFENPDGPEAIVVRQTVRPEMIKYSFRTPGLRDVVPDHDYRAELVLLAADGTTEIARYSRSFKTSLKLRTLPDKPLTVGPGYALNPQLDWSDLPAREGPAEREVGTQPPASEGSSR